MAAALPSDDAQKPSNERDFLTSPWKDEVHATVGAVTRRPIEGPEPLSPFERRRSKTLPRNSMT
jgi:hypothetical protein